MVATPVILFQTDCKRMHNLIIRNGERLEEILKLDGNERDEQIKLPNKSARNLQGFLALFIRTESSFASVAFSFSFLFLFYFSSSYYAFLSISLLN